MANDGAGKLRFDDFVARVNADPAKAQGATVLSGYIGKGDGDGRVRIHPDHSLSSWYEVAEDDVVHSVPFPAESSPLGGSHVWVKSGADIKKGPAAQQPGPAKAAGLTVFPTALDQSCGIACTYAPTACGPCPPPPCTVATTLCPTVNDQTCQPPCPCTVASTLCPTVNGQTCPTPCPCTVASTLCPTVNGQTCPAPCPPAQPVTVPYTIYPHLTCGFVCHTQQDCGGAQAAAVQPTPTATFFHTCGIHCHQQGGTVPFSLQQSCGIACTYAPPCPVPTPNCTLPSVTCPYTPARTGIFNPLGR